MIFKKKFNLLLDLKKKSYMKAHFFLKSAHNLSRYSFIDYPKQIDLNLNESIWSF